MSSDDESSDLNYGIDTEFGQSFVKNATNPNFTGKINFNIDSYQLYKFSI